MRKCIWELKEIANTSGPEIIVLNCSLHLADPNYVGIFPVHLWMLLIFADFKYCMHTAKIKICEYQSLFDFSSDFFTTGERVILYIKIIV